MKITALAVLKCSPEGLDPVILAQALDVSHFEYFQRSSVKEFIVFIPGTIARRTPPSQRQSIQHEEPLAGLVLVVGACSKAYCEEKVLVPGIEHLLSYRMPAIVELSKVPRPVTYACHAGHRRAHDLCRGAHPLCQGLRALDP
ncbi:VAMP-like protein YKT61 [Alnus glutinosa]|uniref:VAMP-like protein YKT61 n=1 Tax=Alnus glutinosa TaxID=3517 RepID=UPI002D78F7CE|nr:VAMP-like protein YKT61 [Alnus glutinosa]